jgi:hypothetical protein
MSDSHRRYNAITKALLQCYGGQPAGHLQSHLKTLALLICGIVGAGHRDQTKPGEDHITAARNRFPRVQWFQRASPAFVWSPYLVFFQVRIWL